MAISADKPNHDLAGLTTAIGRLVEANQRLTTATAQRENNRDGGAKRGEPRQAAGADAVFNSSRQAGSLAASIAKLTDALARENDRHGGKGNLPLNLSMSTGGTGLAGAVSRRLNRQMRREPRPATQRPMQSARRFMSGNAGSTGAQRLGAKGIEIGAGAMRADGMLSLVAAEATKFGAALAGVASKFANVSAALAMAMTGREFREMAGAQQQGERPSTSAQRLADPAPGRTDAAAGMDTLFAGLSNELSAKIDEAFRTLRQPLDDLARFVAALMSEDKKDQTKFASAADLFQSVERAHRAAVARNEPWFTRPGEW